VWIQVRDSDQVVTRLGDTKRSPREGASDYEVASLPSYEPDCKAMYDAAKAVYDAL
jgi:hypothetical protein